MSHVLVAIGVAMTARFGLAKGSPDEIVIFGPHLTAPIDITDQPTPRGFSPWMGEFIDWNRGRLAAAGRQWSDESSTFGIDRARAGEPKDARATGTAAGAHGERNCGGVF
jgi:hypothetical protein